MLLAAYLAAASLSVPIGETWLFRIDRGQPVAARKTSANHPPAKGEVRITARRMLGTTLAALNNSATAYNFRAELIDADGRTMTAKSCVLPAGNRPAMESWPQVAVAVRVSDFKATTAAKCR